MKRLKLIVLVAIWGFAGALTSVSAQGFPEVKTNANGFQEFPSDVGYAENRPIEYVNPRADDVFWSKTIYRMIDLRERINHPFYFPEEPADGRKSLFAYLFDYIETGDIKVYRYYDTRESFADEDTLSVPQVLELMGVESTIEINGQQVPNPDPSVNTSEVKKFLIKEVWFFNKHTSNFNVKILAICPVRYYYDEVKDKTEFVNLFWIPFDPIRPFLAKQAVVLNSLNNGARITFDDLFMKRRFHGYVYKESNVNNRMILEYASGREVHKEQNRIENEILNFEQDLWEY